MKAALRVRKPRRAGRTRQEQAVDAIVRQYVRWREECATVALSYARWAIAGPGEERLAFAAHLAAIDREEKAADVYRECLERALARP